MKQRQYSVAYILGALLAVLIIVPILVGLIVGTSLYFLLPVFGVVTGLSWFKTVVFTGLAYLSLAFVIRMFKSA